MKNYTIPAILAVAVIVAGAFAFAPIDKATAVHVSIVSDITAEVDAAIVAIAANGAKVFESGAVTSANFGNGFTLTLDCDADYLVSGITLDMGAGDYTTTAQDEVDVTIGGDDIASEIDLVTDSAVAVLDGSEAADVDEDTVLTFVVNDQGDEDIENLRVTVTTSGDCSIT